MKLKSKSGWMENGNGDNTTGFSAKPGGDVNASGAFVGIGYSASFWTSTRNAGISTHKDITGISNNIFTSTGSDKLAYSVRCFRNN
jgi:uncharacterized protein (TIGR02145 family)